MPIDALSHATLENFYTGDPAAWRRDNRLSLGGTSRLALARKYAARGLWTRLELPTLKDYNYVLLAYRALEGK